MLNLDAKTVSDWLQWLVMAVISLVVWLRRPGEQAQGAVRNVQAQLAEQTVTLTNTMTRQHHDLDVRLKVVETAMTHMPTTTDLVELEGTVKAMAAKVENVDEALKTVRASTTRIESFLLEHR
jgi:hypothetical protein